MRKILCIILSISIFTLFLCPFRASADVMDDLVGFTQDTALNYVKGEIAKYNDFISRRTEAARGFFFWFMLDNPWACSSSMLDTSGHRFSDDYLRFYYDNLISNTNGGTWYDHGKAFYIPEGDIFIQAAGGDVYDLRYTGFRDNVSNDGDNSWLHFDTFSNYYQTYLARVLIGLDVSVTDPNPGKTGLQIAPGYVSGSDLKEAVTSDNQKYFPKNANGKMSFRTDKQNQLSPHFTDMYGPTLYEKGFTAVGGGDEIYLIGFYFDGEKYYYSQNQYHMYIESEEVWMEDRDEIDYIKKTLYEDTWSNMDGSPDKLIDSHFQLSVMTNIPYMYMYPYRSTDMRLRSHENYTAYINTVPCYDDVWSGSYFSSWDSTYTVNINTYNNHCHFSSDHDTTCTCNADVGYIASLSPIKMVYDVDTSKIPDDAVITVGGDNIYNYYITNPDTGESSTMNEYITNNYTYITNNNGGGEGSGSSGGVGGNVNVSGEIAVGGSVGVDITVSVPDININVNNNGNGGGGVTGVSPNPEDFLGDSEVDLTSYYDKAVEDASGVRQFLGVFFDFLPAELLGLLCLLVAVAICCRIFGR